MAGRKEKFNGAVRNRMTVKLPSVSVNEGIARSVVVAFCAQENPTAIELADIKCAVSEAITNCIVHAYKDKEGWIGLQISLLEGSVIRIEVRDRGCGIPNVRQARQPMYTTDAAGERSGMGFTVMESFMDKLYVRSRVGKGTTVIMYKKVSGGLHNGG